MNDLGFTFEDTPWEATLQTLKAGQNFSALRFLTLLEGEEEEAVEDAFADLRDLHVLLDVNTLPQKDIEGEAVTRLREEEQLVKENRLKEGLEKRDPLYIYLREVGRIRPVRDCASLAEKAKAGDSCAMEELTGGRLFRVIEIAREMVGHGVLLLDLIQEGSIGLCQGIQDWNGEDFGKFTDWYIRSAMARIITLQARSCGIGRKMKVLLEKYRSADNRLLTSLGRNPTLQEIAVEINLPLEDAYEVSQMMQNAELLEQAKKPPVDTPEEEEQAVEDTAYFQTRSRVVEMLSALDEKEAQLLTMRFGLEGGLPLTPEETGRRLHMTPSEVVAAEGAALAKLRKQG